MAETTGSRWDQIKSLFRLGAGTKGQSCDGNFTAGNIPKYLSDGTLTDGGVAISILTGSSSSGSNFATIQGVQQESYVYATDTGSANAYAVALTPTPTIVAGSEVVFKAAHTNTGASTLAVNGGTATSITKNGATALASGDISAGQIITAKYDGVYWQIVAPVTASTTTTRQAGITYYLSGKPSASATAYFDVPGNLSTFQIPANFSGSRGKCGANPTSSAAYTFYKNGTSFGTLTISTTGTFSWTTTGGNPVSFTPGTDELSWIGPSTQDATLSDVRFGMAVVIS